MLLNSFSTAMEKQPHPSWRRTQETSGGDERPCSMRPMCHKGKSQYRQVIEARICIQTPPTGKDELKEPSESGDPVRTWHSLLCIEFIFVSRAWTVKVGGSFCIFPLSQMTRALYLYFVIMGTSVNLNAGRF